MDFVFSQGRRCSRISEDEQIAELLWENYSSQPVRRHLDLCKTNAVVKQSSLRFIVEAIQLLKSNERPLRLTISPSQYHMSGNAVTADYVRKLFDFCRESLTHLNINWSTWPEVSVNIIQAISEGIRMLQELESLSIVSVDLDNYPDILSLFSMKSCKISSLSIYYEGSDIHLLSVLRSYEGLRTLTLDKVPMADEETTNILNAIQYSPSRLQELRLPFLGIENSSIPVLVSMIEAQDNLQTLDLSHNPVFQTWNDNQYLNSNECTSQLSHALAQHPRLENLILVDCHWNIDSLNSVLGGISKSRTLRKLHLSPIYGRSVGIQESWIRILPQLKTLDCFFGLERFLGSQLWKHNVVPTLRQNTSLVSLTTISVNKASMLDEETARILSRNRILQNLRASGIPSSQAIWALMIQKMAHVNVDQSALYGFLKEKSCELSVH